MQRIVRLVMCAGLLFSTSIASAGAKLGGKVDDFVGKDLHSRPWKLSEAGKDKVVVLAFIGVECPLVQLVAPRLTRLAEEYKDRGVLFIAIDSNQHDSIAEIANFQKKFGIEFPILKDSGNQIADQLGAVRTPEVFVLDKERQVRYHGRIDDQDGLALRDDGKRSSFHLSKPRRRDLALALDEILSAKSVSVPETEVSGCKISRPRKPDESSEVTYSKQIASVFNAHCVYCHRAGQIGPFELTNYEDAAGWAEMIKEVVTEQRMPPWHADPKHGKFSNDSRLSEDEKNLIVRWVDAGAPQGDLSKAPPPAKFAEGWLIPEPDQIVKMGKSFKVKAEGTVPYQHFVVDPGWKEDKWIKAMEPRPGSPAVVHHIVMFILPPKGKAKYYTKGLPITQLDWFASFAPGLRPPVLPDHMGRFIPAGSKLVFQMHYTPNGTEQEDLSYVGIKFADPAKVKREVAVQHAGQMGFTIPPFAKDFKLEADYLFKQDSLLLTVSPHMHWRGKSFMYTLTTPDGKSEILLSVPHYDFGWQTTYTLAEPKKVPKGSKMHCVATYDNSADNLNNPDPSKKVRFGEQTWDEMMYGWFEIALDGKDLELAPTGAVSAK